MDDRELGRIGVKVSALCLGTMTFGEQNSEAEGHAQLDYALGRGINFIDAAEIYPVPAKPETHGRTEATIGTWLAARKTRDLGQALEADAIVEGRRRLVGFGGRTPTLVHLQRVDGEQHLPRPDAGQPASSRDSGTEFTSIRARRTNSGSVQIRAGAS